MPSGTGLSVCHSHYSLTCVGSAIDERNDRVVVSGRRHSTVALDSQLAVTHRAVSLGRKHSIQTDSVHRLDAVGGVRRPGMSCDSPDSITVENVKGIRVIERLTCSDGHPQPRMGTQCILALARARGCRLRQRQPPSRAASGPVLELRPAPSSRATPYRCGTVNLEAPDRAPERKIWNY